MDRRDKQNESLRDFDVLVTMFADIEFQNALRKVLLRDRYDSGGKIRKRGELGATKPTHVNMEGTPGPSHNDPTGEDACWDDRDDKIKKIVVGLAKTMRNVKSMTEWLGDLSSTDVVARATRTVPDCLACGDPCVGRVLGGFDEKCYKRWTRAGRPDRSVFVNGVQAERQAKAAESDE